MVEHKQRKQNTRKGRGLANTVINNLFINTADPKLNLQSVLLEVTLELIL